MSEASLFETPAEASKRQGDKVTAQYEQMMTYVHDAYREGREAREQYEQEYP